MYIYTLYIIDIIYISHTHIYTHIHMDVLEGQPTYEVEPPITPALLMTLLT